MIKYIVINVYGITGGSTHKTVNKALISAAKCEGNGWIVKDSNNNQWTSINGEPRKSN
jgi:hypothetical protein